MKYVVKERKRSSGETVWASYRPDGQPTGLKSASTKDVLVAELTRIGVDFVVEYIKQKVEEKRTRKRKTRAVEPKEI